MAALQRVGGRLLRPGVLRRRRSLGEHLRRAARRPAPPLTPLSDTPSLEIVVPCYNHAPFLEAAARSAFAQTHPGPFGIVFVDDRSTDETPAVLDRLVAEAPERIAVRRLRNARNRRQWASLNRAVGSSDAELIMVLNDDDLLLGDAVEKMIAVFATQPGLGLAGAHSLWLTGDEPPPAREPLPLEAIRLVRSEPAEAIGYERLGDLNLTHSGSTFRREAWRAAGGYTPKRRRIHPDAPEDRDFQLRVAVLYPAITMPDYALAIWRTDSTHGHGY